MNVSRKMGEHEPPAESDARSQEQGKCQTREALDERGLPCFGGGRVRVVLGEDLILFLDEIKPLERQMAVAVLKPAQMEVGILGFGASCLPCV